MLHPHVVNVRKLWGPKRKHGNKRELRAPSNWYFAWQSSSPIKIIWIRWIYCSCISRDIPMIIHSTTQWYRISHTILEYVCEFMWIHVNSSEFMWIHVNSCAYPLFIPIQLANKIHFSHLFTIELASKRSMFFHVFIPSHGAKPCQAITVAARTWTWRGSTSSAAARWTPPGSMRRWRCADVAGVPPVRPLQGMGMGC